MLLSTFPLGDSRQVMAAPPVACLMTGLYLADPPADFNFYPRNVRSLGTGKKENGIANLLRLTKPFHRDLRENALGHCLHGFFRQPQPSVDRRSDRPRTDRVDTDTTAHEFCGCDADKRSDCRLARRVDAGSRSTSLVEERRIQNDGRTIIQVSNRFLNGEERSLHVYIEHLVVERFRGVCDRGELGDSGIHEQDINLTEPLRDSLE